MGFKVELLDGFAAVGIGVGESAFAVDDHGGDGGLVGQFVHRSLLMFIYI